MMRADEGTESLGSKFVYPSKKGVWVSKELKSGIELQ